MSNQKMILILILIMLSTCVHSNILVVGSANADTFLPVDRLPSEGENLTLLPGHHPVIDVPGGKGCTQAVAASKLAKHVTFVGQFGNDDAGKLLKYSLKKHSIDISNSKTHDDLSSGRGYVFLTKSGSVSAVVSGGSNQYGWISWKHLWDEKRQQQEQQQPSSSSSSLASGPSLDESDLDKLLDGKKCILLQREVPEYVNLLIASHAQKRGGIIVIQDIGGEDRPMTAEMMSYCDYIIPNETELNRLVESNFVRVNTNDDNQEADSLIVAKAKILQELGARNVLVTRGRRGSTLVTEKGEVIHQPAYTVSDSQIVDETGAGDCYRAAFAVALLEGHSLPYCMRFATAAGSCSVEVNGAVPSTPTRNVLESRLSQYTVVNIPRGSGQTYSKKKFIFGRLRGGSNSDGADAGSDGTEDSDAYTTSPIPEGYGNSFPFLIGSRLNSMKDRPELWPNGLKDPRDYVKRQATVKGLTCVDFNYPQHFQNWSNAEAKAVLDEAGLVAGAVCLRYPSKFARGAMNHPDGALRREAIDLTKQAAQTALELGCNEVVVWSAFDGYDYPFQVDYDEKWQQLVDAFRECCDAFPTIKFSLEYKPTDENTRFFTVPSTGAALLLVDEIDRPNMGLTLDVGHMLMSGENPGQSIAMAGKRNRLFGIQLNDGFTRLAAEDGLMFGSVHPSMALEIMYQLRRTGFSGHLYFDTFPQRTDPVQEAEYNIAQVKKFWAASGSLDNTQLRNIMAEHDAVGALKIVNESFRYL